MAVKTKENVCCPFLLVVACGDTKDHKHLMCGENGALITNESVVNYCLGEFTGCVAYKIALGVDDEQPS